MRDMAMNAITPIITPNMKTYFRETVEDSRCIINWHHNIPLETPVELIIETRTVNKGKHSYVEPAPYRKAILRINNEDQFIVRYEDFIFMFMPLGIECDIKADSPEKLSDMFDFMNTDGLLSILSKAGAFEVSDFEIDITDENVVTYVRDSKIIQIGLEDGSTILDGWTCIDDSVYCYAPMSNYIIWGEIDSDDLKIMIY